MVDHNDDKLHDDLRTQSEGKVHEIILLNKEKSGQKAKESDKRRGKFIRNEKRKIVQKLGAKTNKKLTQNNHK